MGAIERPATAPSRPPADESVPDARARWMARLACTILLMAVALWMLQSYLVALGWAAIIALSAWPIYRRIRAFLGGSRIAAPLLVTCALAILLLFPVALALTEIGREAQVVMQWISGAQQNGIPVPEWVEHLPLLGLHLDAWWRNHLSEPQAAARFLSSIDTQTITTWSETLGGALASRLLLAFITFMALFVLLRDGERIGDRVLALIDRWLGAPGERLAEKMTVAVRGTVNGTILVALGEGILIGIGFIVARMPHAMLFTILTIAFAMLPLGAWFAFGAAAIVFVISGGSLVAAAAILGWGAVVMLVGDNIVQPSLIGGAARLPFLWALVGILGGLETFGLIGLFLGPVIMAALLAIWHKQSEPVSNDAEEPARQVP